jgi:hypothetical protein
VDEPEESAAVERCNRHEQRMITRLLKDEGGVGKPKANLLNDVRRERQQENAACRRTQPDTLRRDGNGGDDCIGQ